MATPRRDAGGNFRKRKKGSALTEKGIVRMANTIKAKRMGMGMTQSEFTDWILKEGRKLGLPNTEFSGERFKTGSLKISLVALTWGICGC